MRHLQMCIDSLTGSTQCHVWSFLCISTDINGSTVIFVSYANTCLAVMILQKDNRAGCRAPTTHVSITATVTPPPPFLLPLRSSLSSSLCFDKRSNPKSPASFISSDRSSNHASSFSHFRNSFRATGNSRQRVGCPTAMGSDKTLAFLFRILSVSARSAREFLFVEVQMDSVQFISAGTYQVYALLVWHGIVCAAKPLAFLFRFLSVSAWSARESVFIEFVQMD